MLTIDSNEIQLAKGGEAFWLNARTIAHVVEGGDDTLEMYALGLDFETGSEERTAVLNTSQPLLIGKFPTKSATNFRYVLDSGYLVFSDKVYSDGNLTAVKEHDEAWESRGDTALVYDQTYVRHWDTWAGKKNTALFSVRLHQDANGDWIFGEQFMNLLEGTGHVSAFPNCDDFA